MRWSHKVLQPAETGLELRSVFPEAALLACVAILPETVRLESLLDDALRVKVCSRTIWMLCRVASKQARR